MEKYTDALIYCKMKYLPSDATFATAFFNLE